MQHLLVAVVSTQKICTCAEWKTTHVDTSTAHFSCNVLMIFGRIPIIFEPFGTDMKQKVFICSKGVMEISKDWKLDWSSYFRVFSAPEKHPGVYCLISQYQQLKSLTYTKTLGFNIPDLAYLLQNLRRSHYCVQAFLLYMPLVLRFFFMH